MKCLTVIAGVRWCDRENNRVTKMFRDRHCLLEGRPGNVKLAWAYRNDEIGKNDQKIIHKL